MTAFERWLAMLAFLGVCLSMTVMGIGVNYRFNALEDRVVSLEEPQ